MISYRALRYLASISVGALALVGTFAFLWAFTQMSLAAICFWCFFAYVIGISIVWSISAPQPKKRNPKDVPIINMRKEDYREKN